MLYVVHHTSYRKEYPMQPFELPLWPDGPTYSFKTTKEELWTDDDVMPREGPEDNRIIRYVSEPTLKVFPAPADNATGAAAIVAPGGGFSLLAIDKEGYDVARWLNTVGVTAIVLKYRVNPNPKGHPGQMEPAIWGVILSDGKRAVRTVRARAAEWGLDPERIGMFGFSAGGMLTASTTLNSDAGDPEADDPIERISCRPDFIGLMYGAFARWPEQMPESLPPMFIMQANDDRLFGNMEQSWVRFARTWAEVGVPYEVHHYAKGGHGFGLGLDGGAVTGWPAAFAAWLSDLGLLDQDGVQECVGEAR